MTLFPGNNVNILQEAKGYKQLIEQIQEIEDNLSRDEDVVIKQERLKKLKEEVILYN